MHEVRRAPLSRWSGPMLSCAVALLGLGWMSCGSEEDPPEPSEDLKAPSRIEITGGVSPGEFISGQRKLEAVAEDNSGRVARVSFYLGNTLACADAQERASGATFSCVWDVSSIPEGSYELVAYAQDAAGNLKDSLPSPSRSARTCHPRSPRRGRAPRASSRGRARRSR